MTSILRSINLTIEPPSTHGDLVFHDDTANQDVVVRVRPANQPPGHVASVDEDENPPINWPVYVIQGERVVRMLLITAEEAQLRESAVRGVVNAILLGGYEDDPAWEIEIWRFARGDIDLDELERCALARPPEPESNDDGEGS
jgi:hypothetical protein